ncbi:MAG TPA: YigZ family protein [Methanocorpusculum sp.]|nr:YigZ family protein [Methanocorpusculum sp.]
MAARELAAVRLDEKKSKFYAHLYEVDSAEDVAEVRELHDKLYKKAAHHCYAVVCRDFSESKADGEVGSPGRVLAEILARHDLSSHVLIVSRLFGGIKLGPAGVARSFREAANGVVTEYEKKREEL